MSVISANTLFHFTKREYLLSILENGFYPRYSLERYVLGGKPFKRAVPMVSFCDIPLSQIKNHVKDYGSYGIGMARHWVEQHKLNPVLYLTKDSALSYNFMKMILNLLKKEMHGLSELRDSKESLKEVVRYLKPYEGILIRPEKRIKKRFYDEREWRYVPSPSKYNSKRFMLSEKEFNDDKIREKYNIRDCYEKTCN